MTQSNESQLKDELQTSMTLVRGAQAFDNDAWLRLVNLYTPLIRYWCTSRGVRGHDIGDCCQDVFMKASNSLPSFQKTDRHHTFRGWLRQITKVVIHDFYRKHYRGPAIAVGGTSTVEAMAAHVGNEHKGYTSHLSKNERYLLARRVMDIIRRDFSPLQTKAFFNVVMHQRKPRDVAEDLKTTVNNVYKAKCRILARIRKMFPETQQA